MIQRGHASVLPQESGEGISFRDMLPKLEWSTAEVKLLPHEVQEHQVFHRLAAKSVSSYGKFQVWFELSLTFDI
jgi:hypothetical protein